MGLDQLVEQALRGPVELVCLGRLGRLRRQGEVEEVLRQQLAIAGPVGEVLDQLLVDGPRRQERRDRRLRCPPSGAGARPG